MLLTKKNSGTSGASASPFVHSLRRGLTQALPTLDRRTFLRRSGLGVGVGLAASQSVSYTHLTLPTTSRV